MEPLKQQRATFRRLATTKQNLALDCLSKIPDLIVKTKYDEALDSLKLCETSNSIFKGYISKIEMINPQIYSLCDPSDLASAVDAAEDLLAAKIESSLEIDSSVLAHREKIQKLTKVKSSTTGSASATPTKPMPVKLQKLPLDSFDGTLTKYKSFMDSFKLAVDSQNYETVHKFQYLMQYLKGDARRAVESYELTEVNYKKALKTIEERFGDSERIISSHMKILNNISLPIKPSVYDIRVFYDELNINIRSLDALSVPPEHYEKLLTPVLIDKIPLDLRMKILLDLKNPSSYKIDELLSVLDKHLKLLERLNVNELNDSELCSSLVTQGTHSHSYEQNSHGRGSGNSNRGRGNFHDSGNRGNYRNSANSNNRGNSRNRQHYGNRGNSNSNHYNRQPNSGNNRGGCSQRTCYYCNSNNHSSINCSNVRDPVERKNIVWRKKDCFICLGPHYSNKCEKGVNCSNCKRRHHTSLCDKAYSGDVYFQGENYDGEVNGDGEEPTSSGANAQEGETTVVDSVISENCETQIGDVGKCDITLSAACSRDMVLLKTALVTAVNRDSEIPVFALFDPGATRSFCTQGLADDLNLQPVKRIPLRISRFADREGKKVQWFDVVSLILRNDKNKSFKFELAVLPVITTKLRHTNDFHAPHLDGLPLAHPPGESEFEVNILIGSDQSWKVMGKNKILGFPEAEETAFGYVLSGPTSRDMEYKEKPFDTSFMMNVIANRFPEQEVIERFFDVESLGIKDPAHEKEKIDFSVKDFCENSISYEGGKYITKLPFNCDPKSIASNYDLCFKRTKSTVKRLSNIDMLKTYDAIIQDQLKRNFIEKVPESELMKKENVYYIPHHFVKKDSKTTPVRIVYDASAHENNCKSLNDALDAGTPLQLDLVTLLIRFRLFKYATTSDLEKAFLHIFLHSDHKDYTRFMWISSLDPDSPFVIYRFCRLLFGAKSSPFILNCIAMLHLLLRNCEIASKMIKSLYMDNLINSMKNVTEVVQYYHESRKIMSEAGFNLRTWSSNCNELVNLAIKDKVHDCDNNISVLGLKWNINLDTLQLNLKSRKNAKSECDIVTKREVLRNIGRIFDPLGFFTPVTLHAKYFLQSLWRRKTSWDIELPEDLKIEWKEIVADLDELSNITFPRHLQCDSGEKIEIHCFSDASKISFSAVCYVKTDIDVNIIYSKNRLAPVNETTMPRLELLGATILVRLAHHVRTSIEAELDFKMFFWCDSQVVIHWINSSKRLSRFVSNRIKEIKQTTIPTDWRYIPSHENPADISTKLQTLSDLERNELWWKGPTWLRTGNWPVWSPSELGNVQYPTEESVLLEAEKEIIPEDDIILMLESVEEFNLISRLQLERKKSWRSLLRIFAYALRFIAIISKRPYFKGYIRVSEYYKSEMLIIKHLQQLVFCEEIESLLRNPVRFTKHPQLVKQLSLYIDGQGLLRCCGRIHNANLPFDARFPILLPKKHPITRLIVKDLHRLSLHSKTNYVLVLSRQKYWIPQGRQCIKNILSDCTYCRKIDGPAYLQPPSAPLQSIRVKEARPYEVTALDYTGEIRIKLVNGKDKVYILVFTCSVTRHTHLEVTLDMSLDSFILAFRRFSSRRSKPRIVLSDNQSTFKAASNLDLFDIEKASATLAEEGIEWNFVPCRAPWYGGHWERMVGIMKKSLKRAVGRTVLTYEQLITVVSECEATINDRPLTYINSSHDDVMPLCPSELFCGRRIVTVPHSDDCDYTDPTYGEDLRNRYIKLSAIIRKFWESWKFNYLTALRIQHADRFKGSDKCQVKTGDVVLIDSDSLIKNRLTWKLGIVTSLIPGKDGVVRSVNLKTATGYTNRPIVKLYPIEVNDSDFVKGLVKSPIEKTLPVRPVREAALRAKDRISEILDSD